MVLRIEKSNRKAKTKYLFEIYKGGIEIMTKNFKKIILERTAMRQMDSM